MVLSTMEVGDKLSHQPRKLGCLDHLWAIVQCCRLQYFFVVGFLIGTRIGQYTCIMNASWPTYVYRSVNR